MTMTPQPTLEMPAKIAVGIAAGIFRRDGGVIRWADSGRIYAFLKDATPRSEPREQALRRAASFMGTRGTLIVGGVIGSVAAAATAYTYLKQRKSDDLDMSEPVANLNDSMREYMDAASEGSLDAKLIDNLIADLDAVRELHDPQSLPFDFTSELWTSVVYLIVDHTQRLAEALGVDLSELEQEVTNTNGATIVDLRGHLEAQSRIISGAA